MLIYVFYFESLLLIYTNLVTVIGKENDKVLFTHPCSHKYIFTRHIFLSFTAFFPLFSLLRNYLQYGLLNW